MPIRPAADTQAPLRLGVSFERDMVPLAEDHFEWRSVRLTDVLVCVGYLQEVSIGV
jgi:hypothetical protein